MKSVSKQGGIYLPPCSIDSRLFPLEAHPASWRSCQDAYEYTWLNDPDQLLTELDEIYTLKLARSSGFCPQYRCQLEELGNADLDGHCPAGLCYTKIEHGGASFGACCFVNGTFHAGGLIGYYDKLTSTPKPIYKPHRIILNHILNVSETSSERFINAHWVDNTKIATQCPLTNTVDDMIVMILQEHISHWFQIYSHTNKDCLLLFERFLDQKYAGKIKVENMTKLGYNDEMNRKINRNAGHKVNNDMNREVLNKLDHILPNHSHFILKHVKFCYTMSKLNNNMKQLSDCDNKQSNHTNNSESNVYKHIVEYMAYTSWEDFQVPYPEDTQALSLLAQYYATLSPSPLPASSPLSSPLSPILAVNCYSGRGRTGSFLSLVEGHRRGVTRDEEVVEVVVRMRERRDGLVETPRQFMWVRGALGIEGVRGGAEKGGMAGAGDREGQQERRGEEIGRVVFVLFIFFVLILLPIRFIIHKKTI